MADDEEEELRRQIAELEQQNRVLQCFVTILLAVLDHQTNGGSDPAAD